MRKLGHSISWSEERITIHINLLSETEYEVRGVEVTGLQERTYCVFDLEGTGPDYETDHITQIGAVLWRGGEIVDRFVSLVRSPRPIPPLIEKLTGITNEALADAPAFAEVYPRFLAFCEGALLVTQAGYEYDIPMLDRHAGRYKLPPLPAPCLDTKAFYTQLHPEFTGIVSTNYLIRAYGVEDGDLPRHDALGDAELISRFFGGILEEYRQAGIADWRVPETGLRVLRFQLPPLG